MIGSRKKQEEAGKQLDRSRLPRHVAIILDGNGRWAQKRSLPRTAGHLSGAENFRTIASYCKALGISYLTVYAFSTENWNRPASEVSAIMGLLDRYLREAIRDMVRDQNRLVVFGDLTPLSPETRKLIEETRDLDKQIQGFQANLCINYGGRDEILRAARRYAQEVREGRENDITAEEFSEYMYTAGLPDPDLIIRPGGELRLSNFLLWQCAYSELYFTDVLWPDFTTAEMDKALLAFQNRDRRYGGIHGVGGSEV